MTLSDHQAEFTSDLARLLRVVNVMDNNYRVRLGYVERSEEEQARLVEAGISPTMDSQHRKRLAADLILDRYGEDGWEYLTRTDEYRFLGAQWEAMSLWNRWGGRYGDGNHFERLEDVRKESKPIYA